MIQSVHNVLIGSQAATATSVSSLVEGDVALFDQDGNIVTSTTAADADALCVGVCIGTIDYVDPDGEVQSYPNIQYSPYFNKASKLNVVHGTYEAPEQEVVTVDLSSATIVAGNRYVLRIIYKDLSEYKFQFTHTYEAYAESDDASDLCEALADKIKAHRGRRVTAAASGTTLTLTAMEKTDNEGLYSINEYSIVSMEVVLYTTVPGALLANQPDGVYGAEITKTVGNPGKGYWKQVRDAEFRNSPYKGHVFIDAYPVIAQEVRTVKDAQYDYLIIEAENPYRSNDNQYIKTTPITVEVYCPSFDSSSVVTGIEAFVEA